MNFVIGQHSMIGKMVVQLHTGCHYHIQIWTNAERGAERALFLRRTAENPQTKRKISAEMRVFLNSAQKIRRTGIFAERRTAQNVAEREAEKAERGGGLMPVSDMTQSGFQYHVIIS